MHMPPGHVYARAALGLGGHRRQNRLAGSEIVGRVEGEGVAAGGSVPPCPLRSNPPRCWLKTRKAPCVAVPLLMG